VSRIEELLYGLETVLYTSADRLSRVIQRDDDFDDRRDSLATPDALVNWQWVLDSELLDGSPVQRTSPSEAATVPPTQDPSARDKPKAAVSAAS